MMTGSTGGQRWRLIILTGLALSIIASTAASDGQTHAASKVAKEAGAAWKLALSAQLQDQHKCNMTKFISLREFELAGQKVLEGRIQCADGREFDFVRKKDHMKFDIRQCAPVYC